MARDALEERSDAIFPLVLAGLIFGPLCAWSVYQQPVAAIPGFFAGMLLWSRYFHQYPLHPSLRVMRNALLFAAFFFHAFGLAYYGGILAAAGIRVFRGDRDTPARSPSEPES